jgi:hypothetical protein
MTTELIFQIQLVLGYAAWLLVGANFWPRLKAMDGMDAQRAIAALHSFRFFGLVFIVPGVVGNLPAAFASFAAYGDFATGLLAMLALATARMGRIFWLFVAAFNLMGIVDLVVDYYHASTLGVPAQAGQLNATYWIPILFVPLLMITHITAFTLMLRSLTSHGSVKVPA